MKLSRASVIACGLAFLAFFGCSMGMAQSVETDRLMKADGFTVISALPPGGPVDTLSRILADGLQRRYGQFGVVENLAGAGGNIAMEKVKRSKKDGHTLAVVPAGTLTINPTLMRAFPFQIERDFALVAMLAKAPNVLVAIPDLRVKNVKELVALDKSKPNTLQFASPGVGSSLHLAGELLNRQAGMNLLHVAYKGSGPALVDLMGGHVPLMFTNLPSVLPYIRSGKLIALGIAQTERSPLVPDVATFTEQGIEGVAMASWYGLVAPAGTPPAVVDRIAGDAAQLLNQSDVRNQLQAQGLEAAVIEPKAFSSYVKTETNMWRQLIKSRNITLE